jgi:hypothetical protein
MNCAGMRSNQLWHSMAEEPLENVENVSKLPGSTAFDQSYFDATIPANVQIERKLMPDFWRYGFRQNGDELEFMVAYDASFPPFPAIAPNDIGARKIRVNGLRADSLDWMNEKGYSREVLITLRAKRDNPPYLVHFIYEDLDESKRQLADGIIATVRGKLDEIERFEAQFD